ARLGLTSGDDATAHRIRARRVGKRHADSPAIRRTATAAVLMQFRIRAPPSGSVPAGEAPGVLAAIRLDLFEARHPRVRGGGDLVDRTRGASGWCRLAAQTGEHLGQLLRGHEHIAGLRALRRADDLARLEEVHEP